MPTIVWFKDGAEVNETDDTNIQILTIPATRASRIVVLAVSTEYNGEYKCIASNVAGSISTSIQINLQGIKYPYNLNQHCIHIHGLKLPQDCIMYRVLPDPRNFANIDDTSTSQATVYPHPSLK